LRTAVTAHIGGILLKAVATATASLYGGSGADNSYHRSYWGGILFKVSLASLQQSFLEEKAIRRRGK